MPAKNVTRTSLTTCVSCLTWKASAWAVWITSLWRTWSGFWASTTQKDLVSVSSSTPRWCSQVAGLPSDHGKVLHVLHMSVNTTSCVWEHNPTCKGHKLTADCCGFPKSWWLVYVLHKRNLVDDGLNTSLVNGLIIKCFVPLDDLIVLERVKGDCFLTPYIHILTSNLIRALAVLYVCWSFLPLSRVVSTWSILLTGSGLQF